MRHPPIWLIILFVPIFFLTLVGMFRIIIPILKIVPLFPPAKPMIGFGWALFLLGWLLLVHGCCVGEDPWSWVWKTMAWAIVGTLFVNQMCVWASFQWKIRDKDIDGIVAGSSLFYFFSTLGIVSYFQAVKERKATSKVAPNIQHTPRKRDSVL